MFGFCRNFKECTGSASTNITVYSCLTFSFKENEMLFHCGVKMWFNIFTRFKFSYCDLSY